MPYNFLKIIEGYTEVYFLTFNENEYKYKMHFPYMVYVQEQFCQKMNRQKSFTYDTDILKREKLSRKKLFHEF